MAATVRHIGAYNDGAMGPRVALSVDTASALVRSYTRCTITRVVGAWHGSRAPLAAAWS